MRHAGGGGHVGRLQAALRVAEQYVASFGNLAKAGNTLIMPAAANDAASMVAQAMSVYSTMQTAQEAPGFKDFVSFLADSPANPAVLFDADPSNWR